MIPEPQFPVMPQECNQYMSIKKQIPHYHGKISQTELFNGKYDEHYNYHFSRSHGAIPITDYNTRNENITAAALNNRRYDHNGCPYEPCGILTRLNGFCFNSQRVSFSCRTQFLSSKDPKVSLNIKGPCCINYPGLRLAYGYASESFTKHMSIRQFPRLIINVIRATYRHKNIEALRSGSLRGVGTTGRKPGFRKPSRTWRTLVSDYQSCLGHIFLQECRKQQD